MGWCDSFNKNVSILPIEHISGPAPRTVISSTAAALVQVPFTSPIHPFRLSLAQNGDFLYFAYRMILESAGRFNPVLRREDLAIKFPASRNATNSNSISVQDDDSIFGASRDDDSLLLEPAAVCCNESTYLQASSHPSDQCVCMWCQFETHSMENRRIDVLLFALESMTT